MTTAQAHSAGRALAAFAIAMSALVPASTGAAPMSALAQPAGEVGRRAPVGRATPVPILMYHVIADPAAGAPYPELFVRATDFAGQMRWLERHGYHPVTLRAVWDHWRHGARLPTRPIVISFDDGYLSVVRSALPPMRARGWPGVLNLTVKNLRVAGGIGPGRVRRLLAAGWELDSHTFSHPDLTSLSDRALAHEVTGSRRQLRRQFGAPVDFFCYPAGRYDPRVVAAVRSAGYLAATTTLDGLATPHRPFELRRIRVNRSDGVAGLAAELERLRRP
jgi:peptidoglycan/xylan/chitin deacetylase (PgdA/CDA1 family)